MMKIKKILRKIKFLQKPYSRYINKKIYKKKNKNLHLFGYDVLGEVFSLLNSSNIECYCVFGTLLGFIRDAGFISHDDDIDLGIKDESDFRTIESLLCTNGYKKVKEFIFKNQLTEQTYLKNGVYIDFFLSYSYRENNYVNIYYKDESLKYPNENSMSIMRRKVPYIKNYIKEEIHGIIVNIPSDSEKYLEEIYGKFWKKPDPNYKHENHVEVLENEYATLNSF